MSTPETPHTDDSTHRFTSIEERIISSKRFAFARLVANEIGKADQFVMATRSKMEMRGRRIIELTQEEKEKFEAMRAALSKIESDLVSAFRFNWLKTGFDMLTIHS